MRKFCNFLSIFILLAVFLVSGCNDNEHYFNFKYFNLTIGLTETVNIDDLPINTDIKDYEISKIFSTNKDLVEINNKVITPKDAGETKIYVQINFEGKTYETYFNLKIINYELSKEEDLTYTQNITKVDNEYSLLKIVVRKDNKDYTNYSATLTFNNANDIKSTSRIFAFYEVKHQTGAEFTIKLKDLSNNKEYFIEINKK